MESSLPKVAGFLAVLFYCLTSSFLPCAAGDKNGAPLPQIILQSGYSSGVESHTFSPDGKWLLTSGDGGQLKIWDTATGAVVQELSSGDEGLSLAFSPDSEVVAVGGYRSIKGIEWKSGKVLWKLSPRSRTTSLEFSPDGRWLAIANNALIIWDIHRRQVHGSLRAAEYSGVAAMAFSPDSKRIVVSDNGTMLWDVEKAKLLKVLLWENVHKLVFSADGNTVWGIDGKGLRQFDVSGEHPGGRRLTTPSISQHEWRAAAFSRDGDRLALAVGSYDEASTIKILSTRTGETGQSFVSGEVVGENQFPPINSIMFSRDGTSLTTVTTSPAGLWVWDLPAGKLRWRMPESPSSIYGAVISRDGKKLVINLGLNWLCDLSASPQALQLRALPVARQSAADMELFEHMHQPPVVPGEESRFRALMKSGKLEITDGRTGKKQTRAVPGFKTGTNFPNLLISANGQYVALPVNGGALIYDVAQGKRTHVLRNNKMEVAAAFSPDGRIMAVRLHDSGDVLLWDIATGHALKPLQARGPTHGGFLFSPDSKHLAVPGGQGRVTVYEIRTGERQILPVNRSDARPLCFTPDGKRLLVAAGANLLQIWNIGERRVLANLLFVTGKRDSKAPAQWVVWSPEGKFEGTPQARAMLRERDSGEILSQSSRLTEMPGLLAQVIRGDAP